MFKKTATFMFALALLGATATVLFEGGGAEGALRRPSGPV